MTETCWWSEQKGHSVVGCREKKVSGQVWCSAHYRIVEDGDGLRLAPNRIIIRSSVGNIIAVPNPNNDKWLIVLPWRATRTIIVGSEKSMRNFVAEKVEERIK